jgi:YebC/PmpR family DNA-binding regulatory protein
MSGHNKWSKIKHKKASEDAKKSKLFSNLVRSITVESKKAGGDINNPSLKAIIDKAKSVNMPSANIEKAVKKGTGGEADNLEEVSYEAYGPEGCALLILGITDNKNRTTSEIKHLLSTHNSKLGEQGSVMWAFEKLPDNEWQAINYLDLSETGLKQLINLIDELEEHDDVDKILVNVKTEDNE